MDMPFLMVKPLLMNLVLRAIWSPVSYILRFSRGTCR